MLKKIIYLLGEKIRNPSLNKNYISLKETEFATRDSLDNQTFNKLKSLVVFAYENSEYYKHKFIENKFSPYEDFNKIDDITRIPIISKDELIKHNDQIHTVKNINFNKLFFSETSGTSGQALTFYKDENWDSYNRASIYRGMSWYGIKPWDRNGYLWGYNNKGLSNVKTKIFDLLLNRFRIFNYNDRGVEKFLDKCKGANYIGGYSSMIYELAKLINRHDHQQSTKIKFIKGTSEKIYPHYQDEVIKAFGTRIISEYGSAETGIIAFECPNGNMHVNEETCYVEIKDGKIIVTNLISRSFPIIRYELGDYISMNSENCSCGRSHYIIDDILGRVGRNIIGYSGKKYPSLTLYYVFKNLALSHSIKLSYRCVQESVGLLELYLETSLSDLEIKKLQIEWDKYFNGDVDFKMHIVLSIHTKDKKLKDFESKIEGN